MTEQTMDNEVSNLSLSQVSKLIYKKTTATTAKPTTVKNKMCDNSDQSDNGSHKEFVEDNNSLTVNINRGDLLPCPDPLPIDKLQDLSTEQKMGNIILVMNTLCHKMIEIDTTVNHNTDGIDARTFICQAQVDETTKSIYEITEKVTTIEATQTSHKNKIQSLTEDKEQLKSDLNALNHAKSQLEMQMDHLQENTRVLKSLIHN